MVGYQEMLTDPSYKGQILVFTYPLIGNYGVNREDVESDSIKVEGIVVRELCEIPSNFRCEKTLLEYLQENKITGISKIDTRSLTKILRTKGVMKGIISSEKSPDELKEILKTLPEYGEIDFVKQVSTKKEYVYNSSEEKFFDGKKFISLKEIKKKYRAVVVDLGVKYNILRLLSFYGFEIIVVPCDTSSKKILSYNPDGIVFSPGPGDPAKLDYVANTLRELIYSGLEIPIFGICLGHQCIAHALGGKTFKLKFGHRGANHPVKDLKSGRCYITVQNHGYAVLEESIKDKDVEITQINLNDGTIEGMRMKNLPVFSVQYHPEDSPGPMDTRDLFEEFRKKVEERIAKKR
jgi:carbamoyl-phosphate synthase small subunit